MSTPPTFLAGQRLRFDDVPPHLAAWVADLVGGTIVSHRDVSGGMSTGFAAVVEGRKRRVFVKGLHAEENPVGADAYREEAAGSLLLPMHPSIPMFLGATESRDDSGTWVANAFQGADGSCPTHPWKSDDVVRVLDAYAELAPTLRTWPWSREPARHQRDTFARWTSIAADPHDPWHEHATRWTDRALALADASDGGNDAVLCHRDLRADNIVLGSSVSFVDWAMPGLGATWLDPLLLMCDVAASGSAKATGGDIEVLTTWKSHRLTREFAPETLIDGAAALAGALHVTASTSDARLPHRRSWAEAMSTRLLAFAERHRRD